MKTVIVYGMNNSIGGIESYLLNIYKQLRDQIKFVFLIEKKDDSETFIHKDVIEEYGGSFCYIPEHHHLTEYTGVFRNILRQYKEVTDTIYFNINYIALDIIPISIAVSENYRVITHSHNTGIEPIKQIRYRISANLRTLYGMMKLKRLNVERLAITRPAGDYLYKGKEFAVISPGIEAEKFVYEEKKRERVRKQYGFESALVIGFVGRVVAVKNPLFLIEVLAEGKKTFPDMKLMVVGEGVMKKNMIEELEKRGLINDVVFTGAVRNVQDYLQGMDIFLLPSFSEGLGLGAIEAQSIGLPCICAKGNVPGEVNVTGMVEFCDLDSGASHWVEKIREITGRKYSREEMHMKIQEHEYNVRNSASKLLQILTK